MNAELSYRHDNFLQPQKNLQNSSESTRAEIKAIQKKEANTKQFFTSPSLENVMELFS